MAKTTMRFGAIIVFFFVMVILNILSASSCTQLLKTKGELERELVRLEDAYMRESTRWEEMKTPERVEMALLRHGLSMRPPRPEQTIRMKSDGLPYPGQISVARAAQRNGVSKTARLSEPVRAAAPGRSPYRRARSR